MFDRCKMISSLYSSLPSVVSTVLVGSTELLTLGFLQQNVTFYTYTTAELSLHNDKEEIQDLGYLEDVGDDLHLVILADGALLGPTAETALGSTVEEGHKGRLC